MFLFNFTGFFLPCSKYFVQEWSEQKNLWSRLGSVSLNFNFSTFNFLTFFMRSELFSIFHENMKSLICIKVPNLMVFCNTILQVWFRSKFGFRKLSTLLFCSFSIELTFFNQMRTFSKNLYDHWMCIEQKNVFR